MTRRWKGATIAALVAASCLAGVGRVGASLAPPDRLAGADRYETAVAVSQHLYPSGAPAVVVASGTSSADALVAGPLAVLLGGPVLLAAPDGLPPASLAELGRLAPGKVVIVGGLAAVPDVVREQVRALTGAEPERLAGADRYGTAAVVSTWFAAPSTSVMVASGTVPGDMLVAAAESARRRAPLLLTGGDLVPIATDAALSRLAPDDVAVVGGSGSVGDGVVASLDALVPSVRRLAGADAPATSVAVAAARPTPPSSVVVVTSSGFADGLSAVALAVAADAPVLLVERGCATMDVVAYQRDARWPPVTVVGGVNAVSSAAAAGVPCQSPPLGWVAPGVFVERRDLPGPVVAHVVWIDPASGPVLEAVTATGALQGRVTVSVLGRRHSVPVMVNGDFFTGSGTPVHMAAVGGRLLKAPGLIESVVAWNRTSSAPPVMGTPSPVVTAYSGNTPVPVARVNDGAPGPGEVALLTVEGPGRVALPDAACTVELAAPSAPVVADAATYQWYTAGSTRCGVTTAEVTTDLAVTREADRALLTPFTAGSTVSVGWQPAPGWGSVSDVVGVNLPLVRDGAVAAKIEVGTVDFFRARAPRTAIGWTSAGRTVLVVVDGRQPGYSVGMTPMELSRFLVQLGLDDGANLDGGGSSALAVHGVLVNRPSDAAGERPVGSALAVRVR